MSRDLFISWVLTQACSSLESWLRRQQCIKRNWWSLRALKLACAWTGRCRISRVVLAAVGWWPHVQTMLVNRQRQLGQQPFCMRTWQRRELHIHGSVNFKLWTWPWLGLIHRGSGRLTVSWAGSNGLRAQLLFHSVECGIAHDSSDGTIWSKWVAMLISTSLSLDSISNWQCLRNCHGTGDAGDIRRSWIGRVRQLNECLVNICFDGANTHSNGWMGWVWQGWSRPQE